MGPITYPLIRVAHCPLVVAVNTHYKRPRSRPAVYIVFFIFLFRILNFSSIPPPIISDHHRRLCSTMRPFVLSFWSPVFFCFVLSFPFRLLLLIPNPGPGPTQMNCDFHTPQPPSLTPLRTRSPPHVQEGPRGIYLLYSTLRSRLILFISRAVPYLMCIPLFWRFFFVPSPPFSPAHASYSHPYFLHPITLLLPPPPPPQH